MWLNLHADISHNPSSSELTKWGLPKFDKYCIVINGVLVQTLAVKTSNSGMPVDEKWRQHQK